MTDQETAVLEVSTQVELESLLTRKPAGNAVFGYDQEALIFRDKPVSDYAVKRLSAMLGIPGNFLPKCSPILATKILSEFIGRTERSISFYEYDDGEIASFVWSDFLLIPTGSVISAVQSALPDEGMTVTKQRPGVGQFSVFITTEDAFEVNVGDAINFGVAFRSSLDGSAPTKATLSFFRPTCSNGSYINELTWSLPRRALKTAEAALLAIGEGASEIFALREAYYANTHELAKSEVVDPEETLMTLLKPLGLSPALSDYILDAFAQEPESTLWGLMNAFTRAANEVPTLTLAEQLWTSAGILVEQGAAVCKSCGHVLLNGEHSH